MTNPPEEPTVETPVLAEDLEAQKASFKHSESSNMIRHEDPFAQREGKTLTWQNVNMELVSQVMKFR